MPLLCCGCCASDGAASAAVAPLRTVSALSLPELGLEWRVFQGTARAQKHKSQITWQSIRLPCAVSEKGASCGVRAELQTRSFPASGHPIPHTHPFYPFSVSVSDSDAVSVSVSLEFLETTKRPHGLLPSLLLASLPADPQTICFCISLAGTRASDPWVHDSHHPS